MPSQYVYLVNDVPQITGTWPLQDTGCLVFTKVIEVEPVTTDRYRRTVALVRVGDTVVNEELIREGLPRVFTRDWDQTICGAVGAPRRRGASSEAGIVFNGKCHTAVGVSKRYKMMAVGAAFTAKCQEQVRPAPWSKITLGAHFPRR